VDALPARDRLACAAVASSGSSIIIVGTGFAGLCMAIRLKQAGVHDFVLLEQADEVGGTWRDNRYPGAACDLESHFYSFSFEPNPSWSREFATAGEILDYIVRCTDIYGLRPHIRFRTRVVGARFDEQEGLWNVETEGRATFQARVLVSACGGLSRPALPDIAGLEAFAGTVFHSARWDSSPSLEGKRVSVIGTGASAVQIVPAIAPVVSHLTVYQRTPPWVLPKPDREIRPSSQARFRRYPILQRAARLAIYWRHEVFAAAFVVLPWLMKKYGEPVARSYLARKVADPALRRKLSPTYAMGCKRILLTSDYLPALQRGNVEVVTDPIRRVVRDGIVTADGTVMKCDVIVLATGFAAAEPSAPFDVRGRDGRRLADVWRDGAEAYLGTSVSGFPNFFMIVGPNTGLGHSSMIFMIESQTRYLLDLIRTMRAQDLKAVEVRADAQVRYNSRLHRRLENTVWATGCTSWYRTRAGKNTTLWPGFTFEYRLRTGRFDAANYEVVRNERPHPTAAAG
jgi:cation diffusion facilitator CzcD-associated flavoprotein CzcO